jgi:hypothetical protein
MDLNDYPTSPTTREIPWKWVALIGGGVVILIVIIAVLFRVVGRDEPINHRTIQQADRVTEAEVMIDSCENADDPERCLERAQKNAAVLTGDLGYCQDSEGEAYDDCVWKVAREKLDVELCTQLQNTEFVSKCQDSIYRKLAYTSDDIAYCALLSNETLVQGCIRSIEGAVTYADCNVDVHGGDYCEYLRITEQAVQAQDRSICDSLGEEFVVDCREAVLIDDPDFDGVETVIELKYGSDPYLVDTDGDGFTDKEEIDAGYNPAGEGRLE